MSQDKTPKHDALWAAYWEWEKVNHADFGLDTFLIAHPTYFLEAAVEAGTMREVDSDALLVTAWCEAT